MIGSKNRFPYRVRIHGKECGAVARALHHKTKTRSLSAVLENVSGTTFERKLMSRITFKRLALALVASLSFSVLATGPSNAAQDEALTVTPSATTVELNESITATVDLSFVADSNTESLTVVVVKSGGAAAFTATALIPLAADSANVGAHGALVSGAFGYTEVTEAVLGSSGDNFTATTAGALTRVKWTLRLSKASTAGTANYAVSLRSGSTLPGTIEKSASFSVTVTAADTTGTAAKTLVYLNQGTTASNVAIRNNGLGYLASDSTLVVNAGTAASPQAVGYIFTEPRNASDTRTSTAGTQVTADVVLNVSGPGLLSDDAGTTKAKSITASANETITVYSDGTAGVGTITGSIGGVFLTQAAKTITFVGIADSFVATVESKTVVAGSTAAGAITFVAKDSAGNAITSTNTQYRTGTPGAFYIVVADTTVVGGTTWTSVNRGAGSTAVYGTCTYSATRALWVCDVPVTDSGVATSIYIADSTTASSAIKTSQVMTLTVAGTGYSGTAAFDKATYNTGERALLTVTSKDSGGRNVADGDSSPWAATVRWTTNQATFVASTGSDSTGGTFTNILSFLNSTDANTFVNGVDTAVVFMPTVAGTYTLVAKNQAGAGTEETILTFTVIDPAASATLAAAEAATDAAAEAIDAANAATDAANLAAEAADAATVAAEEARDAADAATAAVEELATAVATLMAALKAQLTTLANTVAKIAKKVKA